MRARTRCSRVPAASTKRSWRSHSSTPTRSSRTAASSTSRSPTSFSPPQAALTNISRSLPSSLTPATPISRAETCISIPPSLKNTTFSTSTKRKTSPSAFARASRRIRTSATRTTSCSGSQNPSLRIRRSSGILRGASAIRAGTSNAPAFRSNIWANTLISTAAASTTLSRTIRMKLRSPRATSATTGAIIGCTLCI